MKKIRMNKKLKAVVIIAIMIYTIGIIPANMATAKEIELDIAEQVVREMGVGWNLGNTLDAYSLNENAYEATRGANSKYQIMATYSTKYYSGWDASSVPYLSSTSLETELNWKISNLNSKTDMAAGKFAFQIINHDMGDTGTNTLDFTVTKAQFTTASGNIVILSDMLGEYSKVIKNDVSTYVNSDLTKISQLNTTADIMDGTLTIAIKINKYPPVEALDSTSKEIYYEMSWGNPMTTKAMIDQVKEAGFGAVRIPVTYYNHMDEEGNIDEAWLERVSEVVKYVLDNDLYAIINVHHDTGAKGWMKADLSNIDSIGNRFGNMWNQIANYFKDYDEKLLFEGYNELLNNENQWVWAGEDSYEAANQLNQIFVDTVRDTGNNNSERCLIVNTYAANAEEDVVAHFKLPKDRVENRLIVEVHFYGSNKAWISGIIERMNTYFVSQGTPVIIGEFGMPFSETEANRLEYVNHLMTTAKQYDIACFWWDDGNYANRAGAQCNYSIFDKVALSWYHPTIAKALIATVGDGNILESVVLVEEAGEVALEEELEVDLLIKEEIKEEIEEVSVREPETGEQVYTKVDYIEIKTNKNSIDTGYFANSNTSISLDMAIITQGNYGNFIIGEDTGANRLIFRQELSYGLYVAYGWYNENVYKPVVNERFNITQKAEVTYINGEVVKKAAKQTYQMTNTLKLGTTKSRLYACKIWDEEELVRDYVPVVDEEGIVCLYDLITDEYYYGTGTMEVGMEETAEKESVEQEIEETAAVEEQIDQEIEELVVAEELVEQETAAVEEQIDQEIEELVVAEELVEQEIEELEEQIEQVIEESEQEPIEQEEVYTKVDYIEIATNKNSIDTGYFANSNTSISLDMAIITQGNYGNFIIGEDTGANRLIFRQELSYGLYVAYGWYNENVYKPVVNERFNITQKAEVTYINGEVVKRAAKQTYQMTNTLKLGTAKSRLYACKIWDDDELIREFEPVLDSDGTACLYDHVEEKTYYFLESVEYSK